MCKKSLREDQKMNGEFLVEEAKGFAQVLVDREYSGPGQMERAMERASQKTGVDYGTFWSLRYRKPKDILASVYFRLKAAYEDECARQERLYNIDRAITKAVKNDTDTALIRTADFVAGKEKEK
jgi:oligoribonuclease NrnB/cAMP/cGMP phosphodiesterase (DHH superfamily)